jgi:hypothetical protein
VTVIIVRWGSIRYVGCYGWGIHDVHADVPELREADGRIANCTRQRRAL